MKNNYLVIALSVISLLVLNLMISAQSADDSDESKIRKYEIGGQLTVLRQKSYQDNSQVFDVVYNDGFRYKPLADSHQTEYGFGGRFTYNFNKNVAVEAEANYFPIDRLARTGRESERIVGTSEFFRFFLEPQGRKFQAVAGPKIGYRWKKNRLVRKGPKRPIAESPDSETRKVRVSSHCVGVRIKSRQQITARVNLR